MISKPTHVSRRQNEIVSNQNLSDEDFISDDILDEGDELDAEYDDNDQALKGSPVARFLDDTEHKESDEDSDGFLDAEDDPLAVVNQASAQLQKSYTKASTEDDFFGRFKIPDSPGLGNGNPAIGTNRNGLSGMSNLRKGSQSSNETPKKNESDAEDDENDLPLYQWCEQFRYEIAVEYLRLRRLYPKAYEGIQLAGWLEDVYEPIDEQDISSRWGGGTFQLEAVQLNKGGRSTTTKKRVVQISGIPTHFVDDSGKPHPLPGNKYVNSNPYGSVSRREEQLISRNRGIGRFKNDLSEASYGYGNESQRTASPQHAPASGNTINPSSVINSAAELFRLTQQQSESKKEDHKALEILRSAQSDVQNQMAETAKQQQEVYKEMLNTQRSEIERMRKEQEALLEKAQRPLSDALSVVQTRADNEVLVLREQLRKAEKEKDEQFKYHLTQMDGLRQEFRQKEHEIRQQAQLTSSESFQAIKMQMETQRDNHQLQITSIQKESQATIAQLYQEINKLREDAREREAKAREEAFKRESELKLSNIKEIGDIRSEMNDRMNTVRSESDKREREIKASYETREKDLRERFDEKEKAFKEYLESKYSNTIETLKEKLELLKSNSDEKVKTYMKDTDRREEQIKAMMETNFKSQLAIVESEKNRLQSEVDNLRREVDTARKERKELTDPIAKLKEIRNFKETLQEFGFVSEPDPADKLLAQSSMMNALATKRDDDEDDDEDDRRKEEAPKGFLGNLAKYGPQIAQNIIAPVLQRVDNATRLASDALDNQKQELSQQARLLEIQSKEMEQRRIKLEQESNLMKVQQAQALQQLQQRNALAEKRRRTLQDSRLTQNGVDELGRPLLNPNIIQANPNLMQMNPNPMNALPNEAQQQVNMQYRAQLAENQSARPQVLGAGLNQSDGRFIEGGNQTVNGFDVSRAQAGLRPMAIGDPNFQPLRPVIRQPISDASLEAQNGNPEAMKPVRPPVISIPRQPVSINPKERTKAAIGQIARQGLDIKKPEAMLVEAEDKEPEVVGVTLPVQQESVSVIETTTTSEAVEASNQVAGDEISPEAKKAFEDLAAFIDQNYTQGSDVEMVVLQLSMAAATGRIPKDVFDTAIQGPFDSLYTNIKSVSLEKGYKGLTTPRGLSYCQRIYKGLNPNASVRAKKKK